MKMMLSKDFYKFTSVLLLFLVLALLHQHKILLASLHDLTKVNFNKNDTTSLLFIRNNPCNYDKKHGPRVLCAIFAEKTTHRTKMQAIHDTWSKRLT